MEKSTRLQYFPISFFSVVMGLTGFVIALQKTGSILALGNISTYMLYGVLAVFIAISFFYLLKIIYFFPAVRKEINNPIKLSFFPTFTISLLLFSIAFLEVNLTVSKYFWLAGTITH